MRLARLVFVLLLSVAAAPTATTDATFTEPNPACGNPATFTQRLTFAVSGTTLTITQDSNGAVTTGPIDSSGSFRVASGSRTYQGRITGTSFTATHTYTANGCTAVYRVSGTLSAALDLPGATGAAPATTAPPGATTAPATTAPTTTATTTKPIGGSSIRWVWVVVAVIGGLIIAVAWIAGRGPTLLVTPDDCDDALRRWKRAQADCDEARRAAEAAAAEAQKAKARREAFGRELATFRAAHPGVDPAGDSSYVEDAATGERVTVTDVELARQEAQEIFDRYRQTHGPEAAQRAVDEWRQADTKEAREARRRRNEGFRDQYADLQRRFKDAEVAEQAAAKAAADAKARADAVCREADVARRAYEECIRQAVGGAASDAYEEAQGTGPGLPTDDLPKPPPKQPTQPTVPTTPEGDDHHAATSACECGCFVDVLPWRAGADGLAVCECSKIARWELSTQSIFAGDTTMSGVELVAYLADGRMAFARWYRAKMAVECTGGGQAGPPQFTWAVRWTKSSVVLTVRGVATVQCPGEAPRPVECETDYELALRPAPCTVSVVIVDHHSRSQVNHVAVRVTCGEFDVLYDYWPAADDASYLKALFGVPGVGKAHSSAGGNDDLGPNLEGFEPSSEKHVYTLTNVPCSACDELRWYWNAVIRSPGEYRAVDSNCLTHVWRSLEAAGIPGFEDLENIPLTPTGVEEHLKGMGIQPAIVPGGGH